MARLSSILRKDKTGLALFSLEEKPGDSAGRCEPKILHFAFRTDRENFAAAQGELTQRGITFEWEDHSISHSIYFRDQDGHKIEITTYKL